mgnify:CR=1 FL=1
MITLNDFKNTIPLLIVAGAALMIMLLETIFPKDKKHHSETAIFYFSIAALAAAVTFSFFDLGKDFVLLLQTRKVKVKM